MKRLGVRKARDLRSPVQAVGRSCGELANGWTFSLENVELKSKRRRGEGQIYLSLLLSPILLFLLLLALQRDRNCLRPLGKMRRSRQEIQNTPVNFPSSSIFHTHLCLLVKQWQSIIKDEVQKREKETTNAKCISSSVNGGSHSIFNEGLAATKRAVGKKNSTSELVWTGNAFLKRSVRKVQVYIAHSRDGYKARGADVMVNVEILGNASSYGGPFFFFFLYFFHSVPWPSLLRSIGLLSNTAGLCCAGMVSSRSNERPAI